MFKNIFNKIKKDYVNALPLTLKKNQYGNLIKFKRKLLLKKIDTSKQKLKHLMHLSDNNHFHDTLKSILIPRVVGTKGHLKVQNFISKSMENLNWHVEFDRFEAITPNFGRLQFNNIIAIQNPNANRFLALGAHYDSKYMPGSDFLGATDSGVGCALLINLAKCLTDHINSCIPNDISLLLIFFDGEECFLEWGPADGIYGAKHLAIKWQNNKFLNKIDLMVLLDLIGAKNPNFYSLCDKAENSYLNLSNIENILDEYKFLEKIDNDDKYFKLISADSFIEDDHTPFLNLGLPIIHLIPIPFPDCWHTLHDNFDILDYDTINNLSKILKVFIIDYLEINSST